MKKMFFAVLFGAALFCTSCDKEGGKCVCSYKVGDLSLKNQEVDLEGTNLTCAGYEETLSGQYTEVQCRPEVD